MIRRYNVYDEVVKEVMPFGNGSIVYTPKKWIGRSVRVILEEEPIEIREHIVGQLQPYLEHVKAVSMHGSFARDEQTPDSDIDVLVIADRKFSLEKRGRFDFTVMAEDTLRKELEGKDPFYVYSILQEARPILNEGLLEELGKIRIDKRNFKWLLEESESALRIVKGFLRLDKLQKRKQLDSKAIIYSMILRLRGIFLVQRILKNKKYSNWEFKLFLQEKGLAKELVEDLYGIYRAERNGGKTNKSISLADCERLYQITKGELKKMRWEWEKCHQRRKSAGE